MILLLFLNCLEFIFCRSFPSLVFPAQRSSFSICCKAGLVVLNSLNFCLSGKLLISPSNLKESLAGQSILGCRFFPFIALNISCHSLLACRVSVEKSADSLMGVPLYVICHFSLVAFNTLSLSLTFVSLITMCLGVFLLGFILPGTLCASWTWLTISFPMFGKFSSIITLNVFSGPFSLDSPSGTPIMRVLVHLMLSQRFPRLSSFLFILFFYILFCSSDFRHSVLQVIYPFFCLSYSAIDSYQCIILLCLFFSSCKSLVNISCIFSQSLPPFFS